nr:AraC family ligand binding domain-containing protein [Lachnospiraceae bacterium]
MSKMTVPPLKYRQPIRDYMGRTLKDGNNEVVDFVPQSHIRIWYNFQKEAYESHHHQAAEIIYCIENLYPVEADNEIYNLNSGDILFIPPDMIHSIIGGEGVRFIYLIDMTP